MIINTFINCFINCFIKCVKNTIDNIVNNCYFKFKKNRGFFIMRKKETDPEKILNSYNRRLEYSKEYHKKKYDHISLTVPNGEKEKILNIAINKGFKNITDYIRELIKKDSVVLPEKQQAAFDPDFPDGLPFD